MRGAAGLAPLGGVTLAVGSGTCRPLPLWARSLPSAAVCLGTSCGMEAAWERRSPLRGVGEGAEELPGRWRSGWGGVCGRPSGVLAEAPLLRTGSSLREEGGGRAAVVLLQECLAAPAWAAGCVPWPNQATSSASVTEEEKRRWCHQ